MQVTVVSHAGIANRIKNILSAMSEHEEVSTLSDPISYIFPSLPKVDDEIVNESVSYTHLTLPTICSV